jgi:hypothetical protein
MNEMFGDIMRPRHVWTPQWHKLVVLVKQMVVAFIVTSGCPWPSPLWSPPVSLNLVHVLVFFRNF